MKSLYFKEKRDAPKRPDQAVVVELCEVFNQHQQTVMAWVHRLMVMRK
jgi:hypothetical protein